MFATVRASLFVALLMALLAACSNERTFAPIAGVTRIEVRTNLDSLGSIADSQRISAIVAFVNARRSGWETPLAGVPVGTLGVTLFSGTQPRGSFSAGPDFFAIQRDRGFFARDASPKELAQWRRLLTPYADRPVE